MDTKNIAIVNGKIFTAVNSNIISNGAMVIENGRIKDVGKEGEINIPPNTEIIDVKGRFVMPGLIDSHLHLQGFRSGDFVKEPLLTPFGVFVARAVKDAEALLDAGYTTVVDTGGLVALHLKYAINEGTILGPRIVAAGPGLSQTFGHGDQHYLPVHWVDIRTTNKFTPFVSLICDGIDECRKAARYAFRLGADFIKIMATGGVLSEKDRPEHIQFTREEMEAIVYEARKVGKFVHAHAQGGEGIKLAIQAGVRVIAHAIFMDEEGFELAKSNSVVVVPTLSIVEKIINEGSEHGVPEWGLKKAEEIYEIHVDTIRKAYRAGVTIAAGTDYIGGWLPQGENSIELKLYVEKVGMKPIDALISTTRNGAYVAGFERDIGSIEKGKLADIIVVDGDPLSNIEILLDRNNILMVMKEGKIYQNKL